MEAFNEILSTFRAFAHDRGCAYRDEVGEMSFSDLHDQALRLASGLKEAVPSSSRVAVFGHKSANYLVAYWACALTGHPIVPIELDVPPALQVRIIKSLQIPLAIDARRPGEMSAFAGGCVLLPCDGVADVPLNLDDLFPTADDDIFYILHSSGSTGEPKAICITWSNVWDFVQWIDQLLPEATLTGSISGNVRYCFDVSLFELWASWRARRPLISYAQGGLFNSRAVISTYAKYEVGLWVSTPTIARMMCFDKTFSAKSLPFLQVFLFCGEILDKALVQDLRERFGHQIRIINTYGPTEATVAVTSVDITTAHLTDKRPLPIGVPRSGTVFATEPLSCKSGQELVIQGKSVSAGYALPDHDRKGAFRVSGQYRTGDLAAVGADGLWYFQGRADREIKIKGHRVDLSSIEDYLREVDGVGDAMLEIKSTKRGDSWLIAHVFLTDPDKQLEDLAAQFEADFPPYFIPRIWHAYRSLLVNLNSKTDWFKMMNTFINKKETYIWAFANVS